MFVNPVRSGPRSRHPCNVGRRADGDSHFAWRNAGASLTPSPVIPVTCPAACRCCTTMYLSSGYTSAKPSRRSRSTASLPACLLRPQVRHAPDVGSRLRPQFHLRPQRIAGEHLYRMPRSRSLAMSWLASGAVIIYKVTIDHWRKLSRDRARRQVR